MHPFIWRLRVVVHVPNKKKSQFSITETTVVKTCRNSDWTAESPTAGEEGDPALHSKRNFCSNVEYSGGLDGSYSLCSESEITGSQLTSSQMSIDMHTFGEHKEIGQYVRSLGTGQNLPGT